MHKNVTTITIRRDVKKRAAEAIRTGKFPGISNFSALIEYALVELLKNVKEE